MSREDMRAADADRQAVADRLRGALDEGRLDLHEYDERLQRAYAAKTFGELDVLLADLPGTVPPSRAQVAPYAPGPPAPAGPHTSAGRPGSADDADVTQRWVLHMWRGYLATVAICVGIWAVIGVMAGEWGYFWPAWVAGPWGVILLAVTASGLAKGEPQRWAAEQGRGKTGKG